MEIIDGEEDLSCIEFCPWLFESFAFAEVSEHLATSNEVHDEEDLFLGLEGKLQLHQERMVAYISNFVHFSSKYLSVLVLLRCSFSIRSSFLMLFIA